MNKFIFFDGADEAGKTTRINRFFSIPGAEERFDYFRSNFQYGSEFAGKTVDLDESMKHDWRILRDFSNQVSINKTVLVDRSFVSSYVYAKVFRGNSDPHIDDIFNEYVRLFKGDSEFWIFIRDPETIKDEVQKKINNMFISLIPKLEKIGVNISTFNFNGKKLLTNSFEDYKKEIYLDRIDTKYYYNYVFNLIKYINKPFLVLDIDGTVLVNEYPNTDWASPIYWNCDFFRKEYPNTPVLFITGRTEFDEYKYNNLREIFPNIIDVIHNNRNIGFSSKVLKRIIFDFMRTLGFSYDYYDDRLDVVKYTHSEFEYNDTLNLYHTRYKPK